MTHCAKDHREEEALLLVKQTSLGEEVHSHNGVAKTVHVIVKRSPFTVAFETNPESEVNLHDYSIVVKLVYDDGQEKEVDYVKDKPLRVSPTVNQTGTKLTLDVRLGVLSSQLEKSFFKVLVMLMNGEDSKPSYVARSDPIKVISKSNQFKPHRIEKQKKNNSKKRSLPEEGWEENHLESLLQLEDRVSDNSALLEEMVQAGNLILSMEREQHDNHNKKYCAALAQPTPEEEPPDFETAFRQFLSACDQHLTPQNKRQKVRDALAKTAGETSNISELFDLIWAEGLSREICTHQHHIKESVKTEGQALCECAACPHKRELHRIENFCEDVFSLG